MNIAPGDIMHFVEQALKAHADGLPLFQSKTSFDAAERTTFQSLPGISADGAYASLKWVAVPSQRRPDGKTIDASILLSSVHTGQLVAILAANWITAFRTAAISAVVAKYLTSHDPKTLLLVGGGVQAHAHLKLLSKALPTLDHVQVLSRNSASSNRFIEREREADGLGLRFETVEDVDMALGQSDVVVSTVPAGAFDHPFLDARHLKAGAFAAMVDLGRSWIPQSLAPLTSIGTDIAAETARLQDAGKVKYQGSFTFDIADLLSGAYTPNQGETVAFLFGGVGFADTALASFCVETAAAQRLGTHISL